MTSRGIQGSPSLWRKIMLENSDRVTGPTIRPLHLVIIDKLICELHKNCFTSYALCFVSCLSTATAQGLFSLAQQLKYSGSGNSLK